MEENKIALTLRELRDKKGVSQDIVSEACGMTRVTLARYETGARIPKAENIARLAAYYGVTSDYILGRDQEEPAQDNVEIRVLTRGVKQLTPEQIKKRNELIAMLWDMDDEEIDQAGQVIDIYRKR